jgi:hypothetical protein
MSERCLAGADAHLYEVQTRELHYSNRRPSLLTLSDFFAHEADCCQGYNVAASISERTARWTVARLPRMAWDMRQKPTATGLLAFAALITAPARSIMPAVPQDDIEVHVHGSGARGRK